MSHTINEAKQRLTRNGYRVQGKNIMGVQPGIKLWGTIDYLKTQGYKFNAEITAIQKDQALDKRFLP